MTLVEKIGICNRAAPPQGVTFIVVVYIAVFISIVRPILALFGIRLSSLWHSPKQNDPELRRLIPPIVNVSASRYKQDGDGDLGECSICLSRFEAECEINKLGCGHVFHKVCMDKWLTSRNTTCPLCRKSLLP